MSKKVPVVEVTDSQEFEQAVPKVYDKRAYALMEKDKEFHLVCVSFNSDTLEVGVATVMKSSDDQFEIEYDFENATENMIYD